MRKIIYVSGTRADYGLMSRSLKLWHDSGELEVSVCVTGMHLMSEYGMTVDDIRQDGLHICGEIPVDLSDTTGAAMAVAISDALKGMVKLFIKERPDLVVVLGDRGEMLAGALAAIHLNMPVVHIHGGELSGTIDEPVRHAISKLSHYHFTATEGAKQRLVKMGEAEKNIFVVGAPGLDSLEDDAVFAREDLCKEAGFDANKPVALMVFHPVVQNAGTAGDEVKEVLRALDAVKLQVICLLPNADAGGLKVRDEIKRWEKSRKVACCVLKHLPRKKFVSWMKHADVMVGNSSSGIIEAATFATPVVNVGIRQQGRERSMNVIDVEGLEAFKIRQAIALCLSQPRKDVTNVYGQGRSGEYMLELLLHIPLGKTVLHKLNAY